MERESPFRSDPQSQLGMGDAVLYADHHHS